MMPLSRGGHPCCGGGRLWYEGREEDASGTGEGAPAWKRAMSIPCVVSVEGDVSGVSVNEQVCHWQEEGGTPGLQEGASEESTSDTRRKGYLIWR